MEQTIYINKTYAVDCVQYCNFLNFRENEELFDFVTNTALEFEKAGVTTNREDWRHAKVVFQDERLNRFRLILKKQITAKYQEVCNLLKITPLTDYGVDIQLTYHNDGDFFKLHTDVGKETENRSLTFVYYFNKEPKQFDGGELVIYSEPSNSISPQNNMIVFFKPDMYHEVTPITCPSQAFEDSRFTLNGWVLKP